MATNPEFITSPNNNAVYFTDLDVTVSKEIWSSVAAKGGLVRGILVGLASSGVPADRIVRLWFRKGANSYLLCSVTIPADAGWAVASDPPVNLVDSQYLPFIDWSPNRAIWLGSGESLHMSMASALPAADTVTVVVFGGDY